MGRHRPHHRHVAARGRQSDLATTRKQPTDQARFGGLFRASQKALERPCLPRSMPTPSRTTRKARTFAYEPVSWPESTFPATTDSRQTSKPTPNTPKSPPGRPRTNASHLRHASPRPNPLASPYRRLQARLRHALPLPTLAQPSPSIVARLRARSPRTQGPIDVGHHATPPSPTRTAPGACSSTTPSAPTRAASGFIRR